MAEHDFVFNIEDDAELIIGLVDEFVQEALNQNGYCSLQHQLKVY
jgi:hypothetical protein